jgi:hypothetical protein
VHSSSSPEDFVDWQIDMDVSGKRSNRFDRETTHIIR